MTEESFIQGMTVLREAFPKRTFNAKVFYQCVKDLSDEQFLGAVTKIVNTTTKLYPDDNVIAMIREKVIGSTEERALLAWAKVKAAISSHGFYKTVSFCDRVINGAIEAMGGWEKVSSFKIDEEPFRAKDFVNLYHAIEHSGRACPEKLVGYIERVNGRPEKVVLIGAQDKKQIEVAA